METKSNTDWMKNVQERSKLKHGFIVPSNSKSGRLALLWKEDTIVDVQTFTQTHIDAVVDGGVGVGKWHLTGFYGNPDAGKRPKSWSKLKHLKGTSNLPWLTIGDFNELTSLSKREGGSTRPRQHMQNFLDTINFCGFKEVDYIGPKFTWIYQKADGSQIRERLDKALATPEWLALRMVKKSHKRRQKKMFRFEAMWLKDQRCEGVVQAAWEEGLSLGADYTLGKCMEICRTRLKGWNKIDFGHVGRKISDLQKRLEWIELQPTTPDIVQLT